MRVTCFVLLGLCLTILPACSPKVATEGQRAKAEGADVEWLDTTMEEIGGTGRQEVRQAVREFMDPVFGRSKTKCRIHGVSTVFVRGSIYLARMDWSCDDALPATAPPPPAGFVLEGASVRHTHTFLAERFYPAGNGRAYWKVEQLTDKNRDFVALLVRGESTERTR